MGCPWAAHENFAVQIRLPTTSISKQRAAQWAADWNFAIQLGCPLIDARLMHGGDFEKYLTTQGS